MVTAPGVLFNSYFCADQQSCPMSKKDLRDYVMNHRRDFQSEPLEESSVERNPIEQFAKWFKQAVDAELLDPYAFTLATSTPQGVPGIRTLYMRDFTERGLVFFTNYHSLKGEHLSANPNCAANFLWLELNRQVRVVGFAEKVDTAESDAYFASRPRESRVGAWASDQSSVMDGRGDLDARLAAAEARFEGADVPRPPHWGGYLIRPAEVEFWQGRPSRLHDRICYKRRPDSNSWDIARLYP